MPMGVNHTPAPAVFESRAGNGEPLLQYHVMLGVAALHCALILTVALGRFTVTEMNELAYAAKSYPFPDENGASMTQP